jgi:hypothetical protein
MCSAALIKLNWYGITGKIIIGLNDTLWIDIKEWKQKTNLSHQTASK